MCENNVLKSPQDVRILSLFDGMSCGMISMKDAGLNVVSYDAYEVDKYAIRTSLHNFPEINQHGDVFEADFTKYEGVDYVIGGSPCQHWSIAQKNNRETEASGMGWELFNQYVRAIKEAKPKYFIYENNKSMSKQIRESIDKTFGFEATCINSALLSAQNRQRLYWVGKRNSDGTYSKVDVKQPVDKGIVLKDILDNRIRIPDYGNSDKARPINKYYSNNCGGFERRMWADNPNKQQVDMVVESVDINNPACVAQRGRYNDIGKVEQKYEARTDEKTNVLTTVQKDNLVAEPVIDKDLPIYIGEIPNNNGTYRNGKQPSQQYRIYDTDAKGVAVTTCAITNIAEPVRVGAMPRPDGTPSSSQAFRIYDIDGKSVVINAGGGGAGGKTGLYAVPVRVGDLPNSDGKITGSQGRRIYFIDGKSVCITAGASGGNTDMNSSATGLYVIPIATPTKVGEINGGGQGNRVYSPNGKAVCQNAQSGGLGSNTGLYAIPIEDFELTPYVEGKFVEVINKYGYIPEMWNPYNNAEIMSKSPTLTTGCGSQTASSTIMLLSSVCYAEPCEWDENGEPIKAVSCSDGKAHIVYKVVNQQITIKGKEYPIKLADGFYIIRKLSVRECMRLQTVPKWYEFPVSDSQAYKMLGNGWTCAVITWLIQATLQSGRE